jgi:hypothetical protein
MRGIIAQKADGGASILRRPAPFYLSCIPIGLLMLVLFVLLMLVAPFPVLALPLVVETLVIDIRIMPCLQPVPINPVLPGIPVVIVLVIRVVYSSLALFLLVAFMVILRGWHRQRS